MRDPHAKIRAAAIGHYENSFKQHGPTPRGMDWNGTDSQLLRFEQLLQIVPDRSVPYTLVDWGCGYGALLDYLQDSGEPAQWSGYEPSQEIAAAARMRHPKVAASRLVSDRREVLPADFVIASGIFSVRGEATDAEWEGYLWDELAYIAANARRGFSINLLTSWSEPHKQRPDLYYADPVRVLSEARRRYGRHVTLLADYGLWEFTLLVRTEQVIAGDVRPAVLRGRAA